MSIVEGKFATIEFRKPCRFDQQFSEIILTGAVGQNVKVTINSVNAKDNNYFVRIMAGDAETSAEALIKKSAYKYEALHIALANLRPNFPGAITIEIAQDQWDQGEFPLVHHEDRIVLDRNFKNWLPQAKTGSGRYHVNIVGASVVNNFGNVSGPLVLDQSTHAKSINGEKYKFKNGEWVKVETNSGKPKRKWY